MSLKDIVFIALALAVNIALFSVVIGGFSV